MPETIADRIQQRLDALKLSERAASLAATGSDATIRMIRTGKSVNPRADTISKLAQVLQTTEQWLLSGAADDEDSVEQGYSRAPDVTVPGRRDMPRDLPVYGTARGSLVDGVEGMEVFSTLAAVDYVRRPPALMGVPDAYAVWVSGDSMEPAHPHGALRLVHPHRPVSPGDTVIVQTRHWNDAPSQGYIKTYRRRNGDRIVLEQLNPPAKIEIPVKFVVSVHKVLELADLFGL